LVIWWPFYNTGTQVFCVQVSTQPVEVAGIVFVLIHASSPDNQHSADRSIPLLAVYIAQCLCAFWHIFPVPGMKTSFPENLK